MPVSNLTTSKITLFPFSGSPANCAVYGVAEKSVTDDVDFYINGEAASSITIPAGSPMIPIKRVGNIWKVEAAAHTSNATVDHGIIFG